MPTITELLLNVAAAKDALTTARAELSRAICDAAPHKIGAEFVQGGNTYKVERISASEKDGNGWMMCRRMTTGKKWSIALQPVPFKVEG